MRFVVIGLKKAVLSLMIKRLTPMNSHTLEREMLVYKARLRGYHIFHVGCRGEIHKVVMKNGRISLPNHDDEEIKGEKVINNLGGSLLPCMALKHHWSHRRNDWDDECLPTELVDDTNNVFLELKRCSLELRRLRITARNMGNKKIDEMLFPVTRRASTISNAVQKMSKGYLHSVKVQFKTDMEVLSSATDIHNEKYSFILPRMWVEEVYSRVHSLINGVFMPYVLDEIEPTGDGPDTNIISAYGRWLTDTQSQKELQENFEASHHTLDQSSVSKVLIDKTNWSLIPKSDLKYAHTLNPTSAS